MDWDTIFRHHWEIYDADAVGKRIRKPGTSEAAIRDLEQKISFSFPTEFHDCYLAANGFGIDHLLLVPVELLPDFIADAKRLLTPRHKDIADRFFPFIDNECGPTGYFLELGGGLSPYLMLLEHDHDFDDPDVQFEDFLIHSAQSIWSYLTC